MSALSRFDSVLCRPALQAGWHKTGSDRVSVQVEDRRSGNRLVNIILIVGHVLVSLLSPSGLGVRVTYWEYNTIILLSTILDGTGMK